MEEKNVGLKVNIMNSLFDTHSMTWGSVPLVVYL